MPSPEETTILNDGLAEVPFLKVSCPLTEASILREPVRTSSNSSSRRAIIESSLTTLPSL